MRKDRCLSLRNQAIPLASNGSATLCVRGKITDRSKHRQCTMMMLNRVRMFTGRCKIMIPRDARRRHCDAGLQVCTCSDMRGALLMQIFCGAIMKQCIDMLCMYRHALGNQHDADVLGASSKFAHERTYVGELS